jgi:hypothetical protein
MNTLRESMVELPLVAREIREYPAKPPIRAMELGGRWRGGDALPSLDRIGDT